ncbi:putative synapse-associated protein [Ixodes scapularis]
MIRSLYIAVPPLQGHATLKQPWIGSDGLQHPLHSNVRRARVERTKGAATGTSSKIGLPPLSSGTSSFPSPKPCALPRADLSDWEEFELELGAEDASIATAVARPVSKPPSSEAEDDWEKWE